MGNCSSTSNCNPCGPDTAAINQLATKAGAYARQANSYSVDAQNAWLEFNALYLGAFAVAPTVDNEGDPLQVGALYWNTGSNELFAWNGTVWVATNFNEFTPFLATGTPTARNLVTREADVVNVKDFGAIGDGVTDDTAAFQSAYNLVANNGTIVVPSGIYLVTSVTSISGKNVSWEIFGQSTLATGYFETQLPGIINQNNQSKKISYEKDSLVTNNIIGAGWALQNTRTAAYTNYGQAITGFARETNVGQATIGVAGFVISSQPQVGSDFSKVWGLYSDVQVDPTTTGSHFAAGLEIASKNATSQNLKDTPYAGAGGTFGVWLAGGGDPVYGGSPANPSNTGIVFRKNGHTWNNGIIFKSTSLTGCDGITGTAPAIIMAKGHKIEWWSDSATSASAYIRSDMTSGAGVQRILIENGGFVFGTETVDFAKIPRVTSAVNGISLNPSTTGQPVIISAVIGADTNIDIDIRPKGTGLIRYGTHTSNADAPITGYIEIKDSAGNIRKLAVIS